MKANEPSLEQIARKSNSEAILKQEGVPYIDHLPVIVSEKEAAIRSEQEIGLRTLCLVIVAVKGEGLEQELVEDLIGKYGLSNYFTPEEKIFIKKQSPSVHERTQYLWRYESAWTMLWALGFLDELNRPDQVADVPRLVDLVVNHTTQTFQESAKLRSSASLLDQTDLIYRYHWAVTDARLKGQATPANLDGSVVHERHYSFNWISGHMNQDWDDVSTDT